MSIRFYTFSVVTVTTLTKFLHTKNPSLFPDTEGNNGRYYTLGISVIH